MQREAVCGLDIGSSSIRAVIAQSRDNVDIAGREHILGFAESPAKGFSKGVVTNLNSLSDAIEATVSKAESQAHCRVRKLITNISGVHIRTFKSRGSVHISDRPSEIAASDVKRCIESAKLIAMSLDRDVLHLLPEGFYIDDKIKIDEPAGLFGSKLDVDLNIVTGLVSILQNLTRSINLAGYEMEDVIISGMGASFAVLDKKEMEEGAVIIDVGKDIAEATLFMNGKLLDCFYFPFGSEDLCQALQDSLRIMFKDAEELMLNYGAVYASKNQTYDDTEILLNFSGNRPGPGHEDTQSIGKTMGGNWVDPESHNAGAQLFEKEKQGSVISKRQISSILFPKVEAIMREILQKIEPFLKQRKELPLVFILGGVSKMDGFIESAEEIFGVPVKMARIIDSKELHDISFACCLGLARYALKLRQDKSHKVVSERSGFIGRILSKVQGFLSEYF